MPTVKVTFLPPANGWLPTCIELETRVLELVNPLVKVQSIYEDGLEHSVVKYYCFAEAVVRGEKSKGQ